MLTKDEITVLEKEFEKNMYISKPRKEELAAALNIGVGQIGVWFQNKRRVVKKNLIKQKTSKENVPLPAATTIMIAPKVAADYFPEISGYTSNWTRTQNKMSSDINSTVKPQIHLALPGTQGQTSNDVQCSWTQNQTNASGNWNPTPTIEPEVDLGLPETWGYTSDDFKCDWTNHIESDVTPVGHTSTFDCAYDFFADF